MGYEAVAFHLIDGVAALASPVTSMARTTIMLKEFARRNNLDVSKNFPELFDCWNTGRPHAPTADPTYIPDGLARMALRTAWRWLAGHTWRDAIVAAERRALR